MHELSVMAYLLESVEAHARAANARRVIAIDLVIGDRASVVDDALLFAFDALTPGTVAEGARLRVRRTATRFHCTTCDTTYTPPPGDFRCPRCGTIGEITEDGGELRLESMEIET